jgi:sugar phosphate isomerase/epimerase
MSPKFSCADFTFPLLRHDQALALLELLEFQGVDLGVFEDRSHQFPSQIAVDPVGAGARLREKLERRGQQAADVFLQTGPEPALAAANDPHPAIRERNRHLVQAMISYCRELGAKHLTGLPGVLHNGIHADDDWQRAVNETRWRLDACQSAGITYAIEPHVGSILSDPASTLRFLKAVPGLTLTLDYGHFVYQGMTNESVHPLLLHASHFHARGGAKGALQSTVKDSTIDFAAILKGLSQANYTGWICLEYVWIDWEGCNRTDNLSETLLLRDELTRLAGEAGENTTG